MSDKPTYDLDEDTLSLVEVALNCLVQLSEAQLDEAAASNLLVIAEELADRFSIPRTEIVEEKHGDEIIYKPKGGLFSDDDDEDPRDTL